MSTTASCPSLTGFRVRLQPSSGKRLSSISRLVLGLLAVCLLAGCGSAAAPVSLRTLQTSSLYLHSDRPIRDHFAGRLAAQVGRLQRDIGRDFQARPGRLRIELFATHRAFSRALWLQQRQRPQTAVDNMGAIVGDTLLMGPLPAAYRRHNLTHVYTEWVIDRLVGNTRDRLPSFPWWYDGLAEFEAYRYDPAGMRCSLRLAAPFDITRVRSARRWLELRAGPLGELEYCLAYQRVRALVGRLGSVVATLSRLPVGIWLKSQRVRRQTGA